MLHARTRTPALFSAFALLLLLAAPALLPKARAQKPAAAPDPAARGADEPAFHDYKGVRIGMSAEEARKLLGSPTEKDDRQDVYSFNDNEQCQVYYDNAKKVFAVSVTFMSAKAAPAARAVLGGEAEAKQDGSIHKLVRYPKAGYWVSYTRTGGDSPMTIIAMQKIDQ